MILTNRLRFVEREVHVPAPEFGPGFFTKTVKIRVLQQWLEDKESSRFEPDGEWRDVPLEE